MQVDIHDKDDMTKTKLSISGLPVFAQSIISLYEIIISQYYTDPGMKNYKSVIL